MNEITLQAHAKINLTLDVTGKLPNGYHTVKMIMQTIGLHDDVTGCPRHRQQDHDGVHQSGVPAHR